MGEVYRAEDAAVVAERIAAVTGAKVSRSRDGELFRLVEGNLFIVDRTEVGTYRLREYERDPVYTEYLSDEFDPIVRALTFTVKPYVTNIRSDADWRSAALDPRFVCGDQELTWPADAHGSWLRARLGASRFELMVIARSMDASIEEITQALTYPQPGGLFDGFYHLVSCGRR